MQLAIFAPSCPEDDYFWEENWPEAEIRQLEASYGVAIARQLSEAGFKPQILTDGQLPQSDEFQALAICKKGPINLMRLWRWQRRHKNLICVAVGESGYYLAQKIIKMRKQENFRLFLYLPLQNPNLLKLRDFAKINMCLYGSDSIKSSIEEILKQSRHDAKAPELLKVLPAISLSTYEPATPFGDDGHFVFGMAESLMPNSGALLVVRAMSALWQRGDLPAWEVRLFGGGDRYPEIMTEAENLGVSSRLAILDQQPLSEVSRLCHVWLAPGSSTNELPATLWAGFGASLPVITSNTHFHKERLFNKSIALHVSPDNPQELARAMLALMRDARLRNKLSKSSASIRKQTGLRAMAKTITAILKEKIPGLAREASIDR